MRFLSPVVWSEGMHLAQHHFQAQSRYLEDATSFALSHLFFRPYGLAECDLDVEAVRNGTASVIHARGVMPDGLAFHFPQDPAPEPLELAGRFQPADTARTLRLAIPEYRPGKPNCALDGDDPGMDRRYREARAPLRDETTGEDERAVSLARKNFRLLLEGEEAEGLVTLPLARIRRDSAGRFEYDPGFVPPLLRVGASPRLLGMLRRVVEVLEARAGTLRAERTGTPDADASSSEIARLWLSHAVHSSLAPLRHQLATGSDHPERLYVELARLAGALSTFSMDSSPRDLPPYDHDDPGGCIEALDRHVRRHLEITLPTNRVAVPLRPAEPYFYTGVVADRRCFDRAHWFLGIRSDAGSAEVLARASRLVKVCSAKHIVRLVREAYQGLEMEHVPSPPAALSPRIGTHYFRLQRTQPCWKSIEDTAEVGVYAPAALADAELDLVVVLES